MELMVVSLCELFSKMFIGFGENDMFLKILLSIYLANFTHSFQSFTKMFNGLMMVKNEGSISCKCFK